MKALDVLVRQQPGRATPARMSFDDWVNLFTFNGRVYSSTPGYVTTMGAERAEPIEANFAGYCENALKANGIIFGCEQIRLATFSEARFQWRALRNGRPGDLFGTADLQILETPWPGGTTGDLLTRLLVDADMAGNAYNTVLDGEVVRLRPDWVDILLEQRTARVGVGGEAVPVGWRRVGYAYHDGGNRNGKPAVFFPGEVAHFAPIPDPMASYRGMSWLTPIIRDIQADSLFTRHKIRFMENSATPNLAVSLPREVTPAQFEAFVEKMDAAHKGADNAGKTLYTGGGADVTVIGSRLSDLDLRDVQGAGETRIAMASGVHPVIAGLSEGLAGSSLNAGNFAAARRRFADITMRPLWRNVAGSVATLITAPAASELWYDERDIAFLREDEADAANIQNVKAATITQLIREGFDPDSAIAAVDNDDFRLLKHTGLVSVQLQPPGSQADPAAPKVNGSEPRSDLVGWLMADRADQNERMLEALRNPRQVNVAPPHVTINPPAVTVEAPEITINPPAVTVEAPEVHVEVRGSRVKRVERDANGEISQLVEED